MRRWLEVSTQPPGGLPVACVESETRDGVSKPLEPGACADGLDHVVVSSPELEASRQRYGEQLGLRLALDRAFPERGLRMLFFRIAGVTVEVVGSLRRPPNPDAPEAFGGLAWRCGDLEAQRKRLLAAGLDVSEIRAGFKPGTRVCTVRSGTLEVPTLLIEPAPR